MTENPAGEFKSKVERMLQRGPQLSTLATVLRKMQVIASDERSSAKDLANVIRADSVLTSKVLKLANSASFAIERHIASVDEAVVILGYSHLKAVTSSVLAADVLCHRGSCRKLDRVSMWRHSLGTAAACGYLQKHQGKEKMGTDLFTAGLLCNIGRVVLDQWFGPECELIHQALDRKGLSCLDAERAILGVTHAEIGFWAAEAWHFDEGLAQVIRHHHGPVSNRAADIVNLAYVITQAQRIGSPGDPGIVPMLPGLLDRLGMDDFALDGVLRQLVQVFRELNPIFENLAVAGTAPG